MNYYDKTLVKLNEIKREDADMVACFAFGSFVTEETSLKTYKEIRVFDRGAFLLSKFNLINLFPDINLICISNNPQSSAEIFNKHITDVFGHFVTINIVTKEVFRKEAFSHAPAAFKRILLYQKLLVIKGEEYVNLLKKEVAKIETPLDKAFEEEFGFRKDYLKLFAKHNIQSLTLDLTDYEHKFPNILKFIDGTLHGGYPKDRIKLVFPEPMHLKAEVDLSNTELHDVI